MPNWKKVIVSGSSAVLNQITASGNIVPKSDNGSDLGSSTLEWKDLYIDGTANVDSLSADTAAIGDLTSGRVVFAGTSGELEDDSDFTFATDTLTVTKIGAFSLTGKLTAGSTEIEGANFDIDGGTVDGLTNIDSSPIGQTTPAAGAFTTLSSTGNTTLGDANTDTVTLTGIDAGTSNNVVVLDGSNILKYDAIDARVWGTTLLDTDATGADNYVAVFSDANSVEGDSNLQWDGTALILGNSKAASSTTFNSGFAGSGWKIDEGITASGKASAEFDNLTIRGTMSVYEMLIHQVRATNGSIWVSNTGKIESSSYGAGAVGERTYTLFFSSGSGAGHGFRNADSIRAQRWSPTGDLYQSDLFVLSTDIDTNGTGSLTATLSGSIATGDWSDEPLAGMDYVRIGNISGSESGSRQGAIYLTSDDSNAPYIDVVDGVTHHSTFNTSGNIKTRMGKLSGITSARFGALSGYGFFASGSAYLEGTINAKTGNIGTWGIGETAISSSDNAIKLDSYMKRITVNDGTNDRIHIGEVDGTSSPGSTYGIKIYDGTGVVDDDILVELGEGGNIIAGWEISGSRIHKHNSGAAGSDGGLILDAENLRYDVYTGSFDNSADGTIVRMGQIASNKFGILGNDTSGNLLFKLGMDGNEIVGWDLTPGNIVSDNVDGSVRLSSTSQSLTIWTGSVDEAEPKVVLGKLPLHDGTDQTPYGFAVFSGSGTVSGSESSASVLITANKARLAGWELGPGKLSSGTVASIDGNQAKIALGTGATTHDGKSPSGSLFFVSASSNPVFFVGENFTYIDDVLTAAGWKVASNQISSSTGTVKLISENGGALALGPTPPTSHTSGNGAWISGSGQFLFGSGSGERISFDGSNLIMSASTFLMGTSGSAPHTGAYVSGSQGNLEISSSNFFLKEDGSLNIGAGNFTVATSGDVTMAGNVNASTGTIGGWAITDVYLYALTGVSTPTSSPNSGVVMHSKAGESGITVYEDYDARVKMGYLSSGVYGLKVYDTGGSNVIFEASDTQQRMAGFYFSDNDIWGGNSSIGNSGTTIVMGNLDGTSKIALGATADSIRMDTGTGFYVDGTGSFKAGKETGGYIKFDGSNVHLSSSAFMMGNTGSAYVSGSLGNLEISSSNFFVKSTGDVRMTGVISSSEGNIAGWTIDTNEIKSPGSTVILDSNSSNGQIKLGSATDLNTGDGIYMDGTGDFRAGDANGHRLEWNGSGVIVSSSDFFLGDATNFISGSGGAVNIESQEFDLNTNNLRVSSSYGGTIAMGTVIPKSISGSGVFLSGSGDFLAGNHTGNKIQYNQAASAVIMKSNLFSLDATTIVIDSSVNDGKIALGASPNTSVAGTSAGVYMDGTGDFLAYGTGDNFIKKDGAALTIKSELFTLDAGELYITDDGGSNGVIGMGSDGSAMSLTAGTGFYADGGGDFRVGREKGVGISFDSSAGLLVMSSSAFLLGTSGSEQYTGAYISGSNGILSISSSNFFLAPAGDVTMQGTVTATDGAIGGWTLADGYIYGLRSGTPAGADENDGIVLKAGIAGSTTTVSNISVYENTEKRIEFGGLGSGKFGMIGYADNGTTKIFELSDTQQMIAGWTFTDEQFSKSGGGGTVALKAAGTSFYGLDVADSDATTIVSVGSSSTPFSALNTAELSKYTDTSRNFTDAQASVGDELNVTSFSANKFAYDTPWKVETNFGPYETNDSGSYHTGEDDAIVYGYNPAHGGFEDYSGTTGNQWPPLGTPLGMDTGLTKQVKVVGSAGTGPTTGTRAGGGVTHNGHGTNDIVIGGAIQYTSGSIVPGQSGDLSSISGPDPVTSRWNSNSSDGIVGHVTYTIADNQNNTFALFADGTLIDGNLTYSTTPYQIADGIYISWNSTTTNSHHKGLWTIPIKCSGSLFYGSNDNSPDTGGRTLLFPSGTLVSKPFPLAKRPEYISQTRATVDIGIGGAGQFVEFEYYIKRKENPHYNEAISSDFEWGLYAPQHTPYDVTVNLIERTAASTYNILSTKNLADIPTTWTKKTITGQINNNGLNSNDLLIEYTASVNTAGASSKNAHYVDEIRIASQSVFTSKPIVEMNQDGLLVYSSPSQQFRVDGDGLTLKTDEVTFKNVNVDQDINITEKLILTGSFENYATQSKFAGKTTFYNVSHATSSDHAFTEFTKTGSISFDSGSIDFKNRIRGGATGSTQQYIRQSYYGAYTHPEDMDLDSLTYGGGPSMIFGEEGVNAGFKFSSLQFSVPQRFGFGIRNATKMGGWPTEVSEHKEPKATMHVRQAAYNSNIVSPMIALELSGSNATTQDNIVHFRTIRSVYPGGRHPDYPDLREDWQIGIDGETGVFKFTAADSGSYDATDIGYPSALGTGILNISSNANSSGTGRVGIAVENPSYPLHVMGYDANNISIYAEKDVAAYSDVRSKTEIETISGSLAVIKNIRGVTYRNIESGSAVGSRMMGVIAQELEPHLPEIVSTDGSGFKSVKYANLTALLIQGIKDQQEQIEELKQQVKEIKDANHG